MNANLYGAYSYDSCFRWYGLEVEPEPEVEVVGEALSLHASEARGLSEGMKGRDLLGVKVKTEDLSVGRRENDEEEERENENRSRKVVRSDRRVSPW